MRDQPLEFEWLDGQSTFEMKFHSEKFRDHTDRLYSSLGYYGVRVYCFVEYRRCINRCAKITTTRAGTQFSHVHTGFASHPLMNELVRRARFATRLVTLRHEQATSRARENRLSWIVSHRSIIDCHVKTYFPRVQSMCFSLKCYTYNQCLSDKYNTAVSRISHWSDQLTIATIFIIYFANEDGVIGGKARENQFWSSDSMRNTFIDSLQDKNVVPIWQIVAAIVKKNARGRANCVCFFSEEEAPRRPKEAQTRGKRKLLMSTRRARDGSGVC